MIAKSLAAILLAASAPLFTAAPARAAQQAAAPDCSDDRGVDRCAGEQQRRTRALFGVRAIEEHLAAGDEVRRIFYVDGYGRDVVAIAFVRSAGRDPTAWVHFPRREGEARTDPLQAPVPQAVWNDVAARSVLFDRALAAPPGTASANGGDISICLHSWVYTIEAVDRTLSEGRRRVRLKTEDACNDGPGEVFARQLDAIARSLFPHCAALDIEQYRNAATALSACAMLSGDRLAAAEVLNRADPFTNVEGPQDARLLAGLFADDVSIDWGGERHRGRDAQDFWAARIQVPGGRALFYYDSVEGLTSDRVRLKGSLRRRAAAAGSERDIYQMAPVELIWTRANGFDWKVQEATVARWERVPGQ